MLLLHSMLELVLTGHLVLNGHYSEGPKRVRFIQFHCINQLDPPVYAYTKQLMI